MKTNRQEIQNKNKTGRKSLADIDKTLTHEKVGKPVEDLPMLQLSRII